MSTLEHQEHHAHSAMHPARSLEDAANSENSLEGYAAINDVTDSVMQEEIRAENAAHHSHAEAEREEIARLAYQLYEERGGQHGSPEDDWCRAEREILGRRSQAASAS